jgi:hypothetical protein
MIPFWKKSGRLNLCLVFFQCTSRYAAPSGGQGRTHRSLYEMAHKTPPNIAATCIGMLGMSLGEYTGVKTGHGIMCPNVGSKIPAHINLTVGGTTLLLLRHAWVGVVGWATTNHAHLMIPHGWSWRDIKSDMKLHARSVSKVDHRCVVAHAVDATSISAICFRSMGQRWRIQLSS